MNPDAIARLAWPTARLTEAVHALAQQAGLRPEQAGNAADAASPASFGALGNAMGWAAGRLGLDAEPVVAPVSDYDQFLRGAGPAVLLLPTRDDLGLLLLLGGSGGQLTLLSPELKVVRRSVDSVRAALCSHRQAVVNAQLDVLFDKAGISHRRRNKARTALLREHFAGIGEAGGWLLRLPPASDFRKQLTHNRLIHRLVAILGIFGLLYGAEMAAWTLIGQSALQGRLDTGWFMAWVLLMVSLLPLELAGSWLNSHFTLDISRLLKQRLLAGAFHTDLEDLRQQGAGQLLGQVIEAQAMESLVLNGGLTVVAAVLELGLAGWVLSLGAAGLVEVGLLLLWTVTVTWLVWRFGRRLGTWIDDRLGLTHEFIERMVGHRTCLAQEPPERRDRIEDERLNRYLETASAMDASAIPLADTVSRGWVLMAILGLSPAFVAGDVRPGALAVSLGGILLAARGFSQLTGGAGFLARAALAWQRTGGLFRAGARSTVPPSPAMLRKIAPAPAEKPPTALLDGRGIEFRYRRDGEPVLKIDRLTIHKGERILLEGSSGGGKSTLAHLMVGLRQPDSGLLLLDGLDRHTLGSAWRQRVAAAPQFHENHIFGGSLAFNLLMGRGWPAGPDDLAEAEALCRDLGLGELLDRMPSGIMQMVGETGWQLSHGERSRVFLARALLQGADLTVLDESFAALDPESLDRCLKTALAKADTLVVVAHP